MSGRKRHTGEDRACPRKRKDRRKIAAIPKRIVALCRAGGSALQLVAEKQTRRLTVPADPGSAGPDARSEATVVDDGRGFLDLEDVYGGAVLAAL